MEPSQSRSLEAWRREAPANQSEDGVLGGIECQDNFCISFSALMGNEMLQELRKKETSRKSDIGRIWSGTGDVESGVAAFRFL